MTLEQATAYIRSHPAAFKGYSEEEILSKTQSSNDANYYDPTLFIPEQKKTVVKPNTASRGATVSYSNTKPALKSSSSAEKILGGGVKQGLFATSLPSVPTLLLVGLFAIGVGATMYRVLK